MGTEVVAIVMVFGTLAVMVVVISRALFDHMRRTKAERAQTEMFNKMMDKLGSGPDVLAYMQSEAGQNLLKSPPAERPAPYTRILNSVQYGVVTTVLGIGILILKMMLRDDAQEVGLIFGTILLTIGVGLLLAAGASWVLSKTLGLINGKTAVHE